MIELYDEEDDINDDDDEEETKENEKNEEVYEQSAEEEKNDWYEWSNERGPTANQVNLKSPISVMSFVFAGLSKRAGGQEHQILG